MVARKGRENAESSRVERTYRAYSQSERRRRAWASDNPGNRAIRRELLDALLEEAGSELASDGDVLDIGCGTGFWLSALEDAGTRSERLFGVDILPERVAAASRRVPRASVRQADARSLPFPDGSFALVLLFTLLSSLSTREDVAHALGEARRALRPGGLLLCYEPRLPSPLNSSVRRISEKELDMSGLRPRSERRLTLLPPLARRLGASTDTLYSRLAALPPLRSHRLVIYRRARNA